ncbi:hypothetical protein Pla52o_11750 [Novipirellula galeiformis]|uniref:Uncharacterized protein n=1 Tax=Novipirellula galeiformis TaxID=2528004 RepID=A0A5C6CQ19_9BACT|nr:hypothetical protein Pla52o_11750 [Novipirellula galeiformis]
MGPCEANAAELALDDLVGWMEQEWLTSGDASRNGCPRRTRIDAKGSVQPV